ncbi:hypothetical protein D3C74_351740 [compost metagenome]
MLPCLCSCITAPAPAGKPAVIPRTNVQPLAPGRRKIRFISGSSSTPRLWITPEAVSISERIRKGSRAGKTRVHHSLRPCNEAAKEDSGADTMAAASRMAAVPPTNGAAPEVIRCILM